MNQLELTLSQSQWVGGNQCTDEDKKAFESIGGVAPNVAAHPNTFAWFSIVKNFAWAQEIMKNAQPAKAAAPQQEAKKAAKADKAPAAKAEPAQEATPSAFNHQLNSKATTEKWLKDNGVTKFSTVDHEAVFTMDAMEAAVKFSGAFAKTKLVKNLFFQDKKKPPTLYLVVAAIDTVLDTKAMWKKIGVTPGNQRAAKPEIMDEVLGAPKGGVNLFSIVNDVNKQVKLIIDKRLWEDCEFVGFHPMVNTSTTSISRADMKKVVELSGHEPTIMDFGEIAGSTPAAPKKEESKQEKKPKAPAGEAKPKGQKAGPAGFDASKELIGIQYKKEENFSKWYSEIITKSQMIEYYDISGCYILRPLSFYIWEQIQGFMDSRFKKLGVQNCYFPMFVTEGALNKEASHVEGFSPEVAWVTKSGQSDLAEPIAIRPTSETIMYPAFAKWIHSHRDLPMKLNQWSNVVRWEFKHPTPFIRTREFLWQEGHTAHATKKDCEDFVLDILEIYAQTYEQLLAVPVVRGRKSEDERFAGADNTTTCEIYVPVSGRGIQGATSHMLGQNFSKMFKVQFEDEKAEKQYIWQASWGFSTRSIGAMIMVHSDNMGLVLPPFVAQTQFVIIPIISKKDNAEELKAKCHELAGQLRAADLRVAVDDTDKTPGFKFNNWELKGTPVRIELGPKDFKKESVFCAIRHSGEKFSAKWENLAQEMTDLLPKIHDQMYEKAKNARSEHMKNVDNWEDFMSALGGRNVCLADWCDEKDCEVKIKDQSKEESIAAMEAMNEEESALTGSAKTLCIPYTMGRQAEKGKAPFKGKKCFYCGAQAKVTALWGRSY